MNKIVKIEHGYENNYYKILQGWGGEGGNYIYRYCLVRDRRSTGRSGGSF